MAGTVNKVILIGNLGKDPEVRKLESGVSVANFPIATSESYTDRNTGEKRETTDWHDIVVWRGLAEVVEKYVKKGTKVYIEGRLKKRSWQDKEGSTRYTTEVLCDNLTILSRPDTPSPGNSNANYSSQGTPPSPNKIDDLLDGDDKDLPF